jgi:hypothetical protein
MVLLAQNVGAVIRKRRANGANEYVDNETIGQKVYNELHMIGICCAVRAPLPTLPTLPT